MPKYLTPPLESLVGPFLFATMVNLIVDLVSLITLLFVNLKLVK